MIERIRMFGVEIDALRMPEAVAAIQSWIRDAAPRCRIVVTPNVDHTVMLQQLKPLRDVYAAADMVLADGWPVVAASRLLKRPLPERVAGSDLVPRLFSASSPQAPISVFLLGAMPGVAARAAERIHQCWPGVRVVDTYSPPFGFETDAAETEAILQRIGACRPDLLVVGLSPPKQELWVHQNQARLAAKAALCVGATIDFLAGEKVRAPRVLQRLGLEWLHRLLCEPRRLAKRYARDAWVFPQLVWREWWQGV